MAVVYDATDSEGRRCALKTLHEGAPVAAYQRILRESHARIDHPNVVRVYDAGAVDDRPYLVLEHLDGETLDQRLQRGPLVPEDARQMGEQLCAGLAAIHAAEMLHRDLKPGNVFITRAGTAKILDFGIARLPDLPRLTSTGAVLGTPSYLSPEQARGDADVDARADIWSLGVLLYEALAGSPPFDNDSTLAVLLAIVMDSPDPLTKRVPGLSSALAAVVHRCLRKNPGARWLDATTLARALRDPERALELAAETTERLPTISIRADEERVVAILLAREVQSVGELEQTVSGFGGMPVRLADGSLIGVFGGHTSTGDEAEYAIAAALASETFARHIAVGVGRARDARGHVKGQAVASAEAACSAWIDGVVVDRAAARMVANRFSLQQCGAHLFRVTGKRPASWVSPSPVERAPLVGREAPVAQLRFALQTVLEDRSPMVVAAIGPAGIGKTVIRRELLRFGRELIPESRMLVATAFPFHQGAAFSLLASILRAHALTERGVSLEVTPVEERNGVVTGLLSTVLDEALVTQCAELLGTLLGGATPSSHGPTPRDAALAADRMRVALMEYLIGLFDGGPLLLAIEDAQWADTPSLELLDQVLDRCQDARALVFMCARTPLPVSLSNVLLGHNAMQIRLRGLNARELQPLISSLAGSALSTRIVEAIANRTEGNPFFAGQLVRELEDRGLLGATDLEELPLPLSVEALMQGRLDQLTEAERLAVKRLSCLRRPFRVVDLTALDVADAEAVLEGLRRRDIVSRYVGMDPQVGATYAFRSALLSEIAYRSLGPTQRRDVHQRAAQHLQQLDFADAEEIAVHLDQAENADAAAHHYERAALAAAQRGDSPTVVRCAGRALELRAAGGDRWELHMALADALRFLGRRDEQRRALDRAREHARSDMQVSEVLRERALALCRAGEFGEAREAATEAVARADASGSLELQALAQCALAQSLIFAGDLDGAEQQLLDAARIADRAPIHVRAKVAEVRGIYATYRGDISGARSACREAVEGYRTAGDVRRAAANEQNLADALNRIGAYEEAEEALRVALEGCRQVGNRLAEGYVLANLAYALTRQGRPAEATREIELAITLGERHGDARLGVFCKLYGARAYFGTGDVMRSDQLARQAEDEASSIGLTGLAILALAARARIALARLQTDEALALSTEALARHDSLEAMEEDEAEVFITHVIALHASGRAAEAEEVRRRGADRVRILADRIRDVDWRFRFIEDVEAHRALLEGI